MHACWKRKLIEQQPRFRICWSTRIKTARGGSYPLANPIRVDQIRGRIESAVTPAQYACVRLLVLTAYILNRYNQIHYKPPVSVTPPIPPNDSLGMGSIELEVFSKNVGKPPWLYKASIASPDGNIYHHDLKATAPSISYILNLARRFLKCAKLSSFVLIPKIPAQTAPLYLFSLLLQEREDVLAKLWEDIIVFDHLIEHGLLSTTQWGVCQINHNYCSCVNIPQNYTAAGHE